MLKDRNIAIISSNTLLVLGLGNILKEYFSIAQIKQFADFSIFRCEGNVLACDLIFVHPETLIANLEELQPLRAKLVIISDASQRALPSAVALRAINVTASESEIVACIEKIIPTKIKTTTVEIFNELSVRELDVLKLVAQGLINKQIADKLHISLHTVISHRKNITRKLGIKTVSGLTVYAILNGIVASAEIE